ncbi:unnamed protein product, partial [Meganyctiphanes norvegica]
MTVCKLTYATLLVLPTYVSEVSTTNRSKADWRKKYSRLFCSNVLPSAITKNTLMKLLCHQGPTLGVPEEFECKWVPLDIMVLLKAGVITNNVWKADVVVHRDQELKFFKGSLLNIKYKMYHYPEGRSGLPHRPQQLAPGLPCRGDRIPQEEVEMTCDFEDSGICGWEVENSPPNQGWKRRQGGPTMPGSTTPSTDHSTGTNMGHFMLVDAAAMGTKAQLFSPVFSPPTEAPTCFVFYYYIQKHSQSKISVLFKSDNVSIDSRTPSINLTGDSGRAGEDGWTMYYFDLNDYIILEQHFQSIVGFFPRLCYTNAKVFNKVDQTNLHDALQKGSQCIEYELEYEEQQNPPDTAAIMSTASSIYMTENTSYSEETITTTNQDEETVTYHMQSDDLLNTTSTISTDDTTTHATTTLSTNEINSKPATVNEGTTSAIPTTITKKITPSTSMDILTTPELTTVEKTVTKTSSLSANSSSTVVPEIITTSTPDVSSTSNIGKTTSEDVKNKTSKYSKGALLAIAVLILVLCILGVIAISVVIKKYREYAKEDKLLENSEGSNTSIRFSYRREGGGRGGGGGRVGPEVGLPTVNFYGYENPGTPV